MAFAVPAASAQTAVVGGWIQASPTNIPTASSGASLSYDSTNLNAVLFGGVASGPTLLNQTWLWDGSNWTAQGPTAGFSARQDAAMAYDIAHSQTILFGGLGSGGLAGILSRLRGGGHARSFGGLGGGG